MIVLGHLACLSLGSFCKISLSIPTLLLSRTVNNLISAHVPSMTNQCQAPPLVTVSPPLSLLRLKLSACFDESSFLTNNNIRQSETKANGIIEGDAL